MKFDEIKKSVLTFLGLNVLKFFVNLLVKTYRIKIINGKYAEELQHGNKNYIVAFWHGKMLVPWYVHGNKNFSALVSRSKDGEILTRVLKKWNYEVIRGSSHIGGKEALQLLENAADKGYSVAITPDGPTGPSFKMKAGAVVLAKRKGLPLLLVGAASAKKKNLNSWDNFEIPKPFSKVIVKYSEPVYISESLNREETEILIKKYESDMIALQKEAESIVINDG